MGTCSHKFNILLNLGNTVAKATMGASCGLPAAAGAVEGDINGFFWPPDGIQ